MDDDQNIKQVDDSNKNTSAEEVDKRDEKIEELENQVRELDNNWKRALADYQNLQKRVVSDREDYTRYAVSGILLKFLDILDHLEEAAKHVQDKGLDLIIKIYKDALKSEGVEEMERENKNFDPNFDECIEKKEGEKNNIVIQVLKKGYLLRGSILRPAKVVVEVVKN